MAAVNSGETQSKQRIPRDAVRKAVISLLKWKKKQMSDQKNPISGDVDDFIYLLLTLKKIPHKDFTTSPKKIPLLHSLHTSPESSPSCLIIDDRPKPNSQKLTFEYADKKIKSLGIPITRIIKLSKLKSDYRSFESKMELFNSFDVFLADRRINEMLPKILGKVFYNKKKKIPVPVELRRDGDWKEEIEKGFCSSLLWLSNGTCSVVKVGKFGAMEVEEIVDNVVAAAGGVVEVVPKKWVGLKSFHLKFFDSLALPIYQKGVKHESKT
ncbi:ribosomal L1 domain-containing protein 1-like [Cynara cardunculus var. scolymus]|uniref:Ribosomal L1 domain-containing protein 1 n=1 Tax=Cynara cardunculus var. scolymus TaxID=59895 RepID=A0A103YN90_CYNCS|nr:ribosomal L1 domain-containing protein 1-like [Cynara cardunculus var. scolymus]KVI12188.1 Ribosomal protein L1 [Cynara cardunculus var. scolymus]